MVAMLKIASGMNYAGKYEYEYHGKYQEKWKDWNATGIYKKFMEEIFLKKDEVYAGYGAVIERMEDVIDNTEKLKEISEALWLRTILGELSALCEDLV